MGAETSIDSIKPLQPLQPLPTHSSRPKLNFTGIKEKPITNFFSCICTQSDPNLQQDSPSRQKSISRPINRQTSSIKSSSPSNTITLQNSISNSALVPNHFQSTQPHFQLISTTTKGKKFSNTPKSAKPFEPSIPSIPSNQTPSNNLPRSSISSVADLSSEFHQSSDRTLSKSSNKSSLYSLTSELKAVKKSLQISHSLLYAVDDLDEDFPTTLSKDTVLMRDGERKYKGEALNGQPHGYGAEVWPDGSRYEGTYIEGSRTGQGMYTWPDRSCYKGSFKENQMTGFGVFAWPNGNRYEGMWKDSKMHGEGKYTWHNGNVYTGGYKEGLKHGDGVFVYANGKEIKAKWLLGAVQLAI